MTTKTVETLVDDLYNLFEEGYEATPEQTESLGKAMAETIAYQLREHTKTRPRHGHLRMSGIGKPMRQTWYDVKGYERKPIDPPTKIKFLYGHILEDLLLHLTRWAGHTVTHEQHEIDIDGVKGHMDAVIDGAVVDVKTAAPRSWETKFNQEGLVNNDPYGYISQISSYATAMGKDEGHFLALCKDSGRLKLLTIDELEFDDVSQRIKDHRENLKSDTPPPRCHEPIKHGDNGNMKLSGKCKFCDFKAECWKDEVRIFRYSNEDIWMTKVVKEPRVDEVTEEYYA